MSDIPKRGCCAQEFYTKVQGLSLVHEIPICTHTGFNCIWFGEETKCNRYKAIRKRGYEMTDCEFNSGCCDTYCGGRCWERDDGESDGNEGEEE